MVVALRLASLPLIRKLSLALIVVPLLFLAPLLNRHVMPYRASSDGTKETMMNHMTTNATHNGA